MIIRIGYDIQFSVSTDTPIVTLLNVHPSRDADLIEPDVVRTEPQTPTQVFIDHLGNKGARILARAGKVRFHNNALVHDSGLPDEQGLNAPEVPVHQLPATVLPYLMSSRYCEVDLLVNTAAELFGDVLVAGSASPRSATGFIRMSRSATNLPVLHAPLLASIPNASAFAEIFNT